MSILPPGKIDHFAPSPLRALSEKFGVPNERWDWYMSQLLRMATDAHVADRRVTFTCTDPEIVGCVEMVLEAVLGVAADGVGALTLGDQERVDDRFAIVELVNRQRFAGRIEHRWLADVLVRVLHYRDGNGTRRERDLCDSVFSIEYVSEEKCVTVARNLHQAGEMRPLDPSLTDEPSGRAHAPDGWKWVHSHRLGFICGLVPEKVDLRSVEIHSVDGIDYVVASGAVEKHVMKAAIVEAERLDAVEIPF